MSDYTQITDFSAKDALASGDPEKIATGADVDAELAAISTAIATKANDDAVVHDTGTETVAGDKTFSGNNTHSGTNMFSGTITVSGKPIELAKGANVASAATTDIWANDDGNALVITGTTTITSFGTAPQAGAVRLIVFASALILTHDGATITLPGAANITTAAGDVALVYANTTTDIRVVSYQRASGQPVSAVTQAFVADAAVGQGELKTDVGSSAAQLAAGAAVGVSINDYSFFPNFTDDGDPSAASEVVITLVDSATNDTVGKFGLLNNGAGANNYDVHWRFITASRPSEIVVLRRKSTGEVVSVWKSQIDDPDEPPIKMRDPDMEAVEVVKFPDTLLKGSASDILKRVRAGTMRLSVSDKYCDAAIIPDQVHVRPRGIIGTRKLQADDHPLMVEAIKKGRVICAGVKLAELV